MSNAGARILRSVRAARSYARGEVTEGFVAHVPEVVDVKAIRQTLGLSQGAFAQRFGLSPAAIRDWEQQRRQPDPAARVLLLVIAHDPDVVVKALQRATAETIFNFHPLSNRLLDGQVHRSGAFHTWFAGTGKFWHMISEEQFASGNPHPTAKRHNQGLDAQFT